VVQAIIKSIRVDALATKEAYGRTLVIKLRKG